MCIVFHSHVDKGQNGVNEVDLAKKEGDVYIILIEYYWWEQVNIISMHAYSSYDYNRFVSSRRQVALYSQQHRYKITAPEETWSVCFTKLHKPCKYRRIGSGLTERLVEKDRNRNGTLYLDNNPSLSTILPSMIHCPQNAKDKNVELKVSADYRSDRLL